MKMKYVPNIISVFRIVATAALLFTSAFSNVFFGIYVLAGVSDVLDGWIARSTGNTSELGARLDSIADLLFYAVMAVKLFPVLLLRLPFIIWCMLGIVLVLRLASYGAVAIRYGRFASLHTYMNKLTGAVVFLVPFVIRTTFAVAFCVLGCIIALMAVLEELVIHVSGNAYNSEVKTLLWNRLGDKDNEIPTY